MMKICSIQFSASFLHKWISKTGLSAPNITNLDVLLSFHRTSAPQATVKSQLPDVFRKNRPEWKWCLTQNKIGV